MDSASKIPGARRYNPTNTNRSNVRKTNLFRDLRRSALICCRTRISTSSRALDRNKLSSQGTPQQYENVDHRDEHHPIRPRSHNQTGFPTRTAITAPVEALRLEIDHTGEEWRVLDGSKVLGSCRDLQSLPPMVQGILSSVALRHHDFLLALHAGGVAWADKVMLLVGKSRSGKSTLTAALLGEGWDYLSDDMILIERESLDAKSMPCSLGIKPGGWELLASRFPRREPPRQHLRADGQSVGYFSPPPPRRGFLLPRTVQWIVFPSLSPAEPGNLQALSPLEGLQRLVTHCCGIPSALQPGDIRRLIEFERRRQLVRTEGRRSRYSRRPLQENCAQA